MVSCSVKVPVKSPSEKSQWKVPVNVLVHISILHQYTWFIALDTMFAPGYAPGRALSKYILSTYQYIHQYTWFIALYTMFSSKKRICKIMYNLRNSNSRSHADRKAALTTAPRALIQDCVCARYHSVWFCIAGRTSPGGWCRTSGAGPPAPPAPAMTSPAWAFQFT